MCSAARLPVEALVSKLDYCADAKPPSLHFSPSGPPELENLHEKIVQAQKAPASQILEQVPTGTGTIYLILLVHFVIGLII